MKYQNALVFYMGLLFYVQILIFKKLCWILKINEMKIKGAGRSKESLIQNCVYKHI